MRIHTSDVLQETGVFDRFYEHDLERFSLRLEEMLRVIHLPAGLRLDLPSVVIRARSDMKAELTRLAVRTLIAELHRLKSEGKLPGEDGRARYEAFNASLCSPETRRELFVRYPLLSELLDRAVALRLAVLAEACSRLANDFEAIRRELGFDGCLLEHVRADAGDRHRGGRSVLLFEFGDGRKLVYKPRPMSADMSFRRLVEWLHDKRRLRHELRLPETLDRGTHGWQSFVEYRECSSEAELEAFYYRIGALLALFYVIRSSDIHYENLIACGEHPVVVDLETLLTNRPPGAADGTLLHAFGREWAESVLGCMLLPTNAPFGVFDIDVSGLAGKGGERSERMVVYRLTGAGTDEIRLTPEFFITQEQHNRPALNGRKAEPSTYVGAIVRGFTDTYETVFDHRDELAEQIRRGDLFVGEFRQVLRPTHVYARFLEASLHPKYLGNREARRSLFAMLMPEKTAPPSLRRKAELEIQDLLDGDIPYFSVEFRSHDLISANGGVIDCFFEATLCDLVLDRLKKLSREDLRRQLRLIAASLKTSETGASVHRPPETAAALEPTATPPSGGWSGERLRQSCLDAAVSIGDWLEHHAVWNEDRTRCTWLTAVVSGDHKMSLGPLNDSLYEGGGAALFLARLAEVTGSARFRRLARAAWMGIEELWRPAAGIAFGEPAGSGEPQRPGAAVPDNPSAFHGIGSTAYLARSLAEIWNDDELYRLYESQLQRLAEYPLSDDAPADFLGGSAGVVVACLRFYDADKLAPARQAAERFGNHLRARAKAILENGGSAFLTGLSHGCSGLSWALVALGRTMGDGEAVRLGFRLIEAENRQFAPAKNNWRDLRPGVPPTADPVYWCHGAPGIGLARAHLLAEPDGLSRAELGLLRKDVHTAVAKTLAAGFPSVAELGLCHGAFGNLNVLLEISEKINDESLLRSIEQQTEICLSKLPLADGVDGWNTLSHSLGLMLGLTGVGYALLRLAVPRAVPSVLSLELPERKGGAS